MKNLVSPLLFTFLFFSLITSCSEDPATALQNEVIDVHDEVMPEMVVVNRLVDSLVQLTANNESMNPADSVNILRHIDGLMRADKMMNEWMEEFKMHTGDTSYLKKELDKISRIGIFTDDMIKNSRRVLTTHEG